MIRSRSAPVSVVHLSTISDGITFGQPLLQAGTDSLMRQDLPGVDLAESLLDFAHEPVVVVDSSLHKQGDALTFLYGDSGTVPVDTAPGGTRFVRLDLNGRQFVILK